MLEIFRQLCSFISQIYGASGECVHISQSYIKRTSEGIQKVRGLFARISCRINVEYNILRYTFHETNAEM